MRRSLLMMLWTAPALRHRNAVDCLSQAERFKEVRQATTVAFEVEGIGEDRRGNADKVDPGIGTTRVGPYTSTHDPKRTSWSPNCCCAIKPKTTFRFPSEG